LRRCGVEYTFDESNFLWPASWRSYVNLTMGAKQLFAGINTRIDASRTAPLDWAARIATCSSIPISAVCHTTRKLRLAKAPWRWRFGRIVLSRFSLGHAVRTLLRARALRTIPRSGLMGKQVVWRAQPGQEAIEKKSRLVTVHRHTPCFSWSGSPQSEAGNFRRLASVAE